MERSAFGGLGPRIWLQAFCRFAICVGAQMWPSCVYLKTRCVTLEEEVSSSSLVLSVPGVSLLWQVISCSTGITVASD